MHNKTFIITKGGILYSPIYKDIFEAAKQNAAFFVAGFERKSDVIPLHVAVNIPVPYISKQIKDNFVRDMISTDKWSVQIITDKDIQKLKEIQQFNKLVKDSPKGMNGARWWWTDLITGNSYFVYSDNLFKSFGTIDMTFDHEF